MRECECVHCGEPVVVAGRNETITAGETPREHLRRTGHVHVRDPRPMACEDCENVWMYGGDADRPTCPNCAGKRVEPATD